MTTDATKPMKPVMPVELGRFHAAKGVTNSNCDRCGKTEWTLLSDKDTPGGAIPSASDESAANINLFFPVLVLICANCGNVWLQSYQHVRAWLDSTPTLRRPT